MAGILARQVEGLVTRDLGLGMRVQGSGRREAVRFSDSSDPEPRTLNPEP